MALLPGNMPLHPQEGSPSTFDFIHLALGNNQLKEATGTSGMC